MPARRPREAAPAVPADREASTCRATSSCRRRRCSSTSRPSRATATTSGACKEDFRRLWDTGFLDDMRSTCATARRARSSCSRSSERKRIQIVDYRGSKALTTSNIEDELKKKDAALRIDSFYDPGKARRVEAIIREMLKEKGRPFATVKHDAKTVGGAGHAGLLHHRRRAQEPRSSRSSSTATRSSPTASCAGRMKKIKPRGLLEPLLAHGRQEHLHRREVGGAATRATAARLQRATT